MIRKNLVQGRHNETASARKNLVSAPDHIIRRAQLWLQQPENQPAGRAYGIRHVLEAKRTAHARLDEDRMLIPVPSLNITVMPPSAPAVT